jgi:PAS domain S-box-containing protein
MWEGVDKRILQLALGAAIVVIVVAPTLVLRAISQNSLEATELVGHTNQVRAEAADVLYAARDTEAAALLLSSGIQSPLLQNRMHQSSAALAPGLGRLAALTRDNPDQQLRIGSLKANIEARMALALQLASATDPGIVATDRRELATHYPIHGLANAIVAEEAQLLARRTVEAARQRRLSDSLRFAALAAQLGLLAVIAGFWLRTLRAREAAEAVSRRADVRAQAVLQSVREPIVLVDEQLRVVMRNEAFEELYSDGEDLQGRALTDAAGDAWNDPAFLQRLRDVLQRDRELWDYELLQRTAGGVSRTLLVNARRMPLPDRDERVILMTASDITSRKASEDQIRQLNRQLEGKIDQVSEVNRELEAFSYSVSHDLRAPLRHIAGFGEKLGKHLGEAADDRSHHYLQVITTSAKRMSALIDDLLVYSRLGRSALRSQPVDMQSMVDEVRAMLDSNARTDQPDHRIEWRIAPLPIVLGDENMLRQVWSNLLGNAVKYSMHRPVARIEVGYRLTGEDQHAFEVADNGAGFDMQYAGKLFGVFQRLHKASEFPGTGVGLASVRRILLRHDGRISAEATPDQGATFRFSLPASEPIPTQDPEGNLP